MLSSSCLCWLSSTSSRHTRNEDRHPQKVVALKDQQLCQKHPEYVLHRRTVPHPSPVCRPQAAQGPPDTLSNAEGPVFRKIHLYYLENILPEFPRTKISHPQIMPSLWSIVICPNKCFSDNSDVFSVYCWGHGFGVPQGLCL